MNKNTDCLHKTSIFLTTQYLSHIWLPHIRPLLHQFNELVNLINGTITEYPVGGEQIIGGGPKKPIASGSLYPNRKFVIKNRTVKTENGQTYLRYYLQKDDGTVSTTAHHLKRLGD